MSTKITVPSLGESVTEATIAKWYKKPGETVKVDELIVELETEKVTLEVNAPATGTIEDITIGEGETVAVGDEIGSMKEGAVASAETPNNNSTATSSQTSSSPAEGNSNKSSSKSDIFSPAAAKISREKGIESNQISGSGKDGRITKSDAVSATTNSSANNVSAVVGNASEEVLYSQRVEERVKMSRLRKTIAQRLKESQNTAAMLTTFNEIDMKNVIELRKRYKDKFQQVNGIKLGFMSFFAKAVVTALQELPAVNAKIDGDDIVYRNYCDIGVAVGTEQGLVVPVVRDADKLSFAGLESKIAELGKKARDGKLSMSELQGGTFSITNGGVYGSLMSTPIINPPQSGILGMHNTVERPVAVDGKVEIRPMMYVALSYDHRIVDGKEAVTFLVRVKESIENPERMLLGL